MKMRLSASSTSRRTRRRVKVPANRSLHLLASSVTSFVLVCATILHGCSTTADGFVMRQAERLTSLTYRVHSVSDHKYPKMTHPMSSYNAADAADGTTGTEHLPKDVPDYVTSPVLQQVYSDLLANVNKYGHPNIPLGTSSGRKCKTLRRLAFQNKLSPQEMDLLESIGFRFNSLEDVYKEADFDECLARLLEYERINKTGYQIPKKYKEDPELGAWVTMIRRIGRDDIEPERRKKLDGIGFAWVSNRKCGSSFMKNYRPIRDLLAEQGEVGVPIVLSNETMFKWLKAQREAYEKGNLSAERIEYLEKLRGLDWKKL